jgi:pseudouridine synthase
MRLHRFIGLCGHTSRRRAELLVEAGRVEVNGKVITRIGSIVNPRRDVVSVNGERIVPPEPLTILFNKPTGIITSTHDTHNRLTVMDLLPGSIVGRGVQPVGRLDLDTEGLLVLTNDGDLSHRVTHPRFETEKEYIALVRGHPAASAVRRLEEGVRIEGQRTAPARIEVIKKLANTTEMRLVIHEGKKRQIRRMYELIDSKVLELKRVRVGDLRLGNLASGTWRKLSNEEIAKL